MIEVLSLPNALSGQLTDAVGDILHVGPFRTLLISQHKLFLFKFIKLEIIEIAIRIKISTDFFILVVPFRLADPLPKH